MKKSHEKIFMIIAIILIFINIGVYLWQKNFEKEYKNQNIVAIK